MSDGISTLRYEIDEKQIGYRLSRLSIDHFHIHSWKNFINELSKNEDGGYQVNFNVIANNSLIYDQEIVQSQVLVQVSCKEKGDSDISHVISDITTATDFLVTPISNLVDQERKILTLPFHLSSTFSSVAYGTTRGILYEKMAGSPFGSFTMPLMNLANIERKNVEFDISRFLK